MRSSFLKNSLLKNKAISLTVTLFIALAAMVISTALGLLPQLTGAVDQMMAKAKTPHFMQMHSGEYDEAKLMNFAKTNDQVADFQVLEFLNLDNASIRLGDKDLADSVQDHGISIPSPSFDLLLDLAGKPIQPQPGEVYVPLGYESLVKPGQIAKLVDRELRVQGYFRDSQMNSPLSSSKRLLVHPKDFTALREKGTMERLIEFRVKDLSQLADFEKDYLASGSPANGPAITYPMFRIINSLTDGILIAILILAGGLVLAVALLCLRLGLLAKVEEDYVQIGIMKAVGLTSRQVGSYYLSLYDSFAWVGALLGWFLSLPLTGLLANQLKRNMGAGQASLWTSLIALLGAGLVALLVGLFCRRVLRQLSKISPAQAIRFGNQGGKEGAVEALSLAKRKLPINLNLALADIFSRRKLYLTLFFLGLVLTFVMALPRSFLYTISQDSFASHMGFGRADVFLRSMDQSQDPSMASSLKALPEVEKLSSFKTVSLAAKGKTGEDRLLQVEVGPHREVGLVYQSGAAPAGPGQIALSVLNAEDFGVKVGDTIELRLKEGFVAHKLTGIYSDLSNGGKTAKADFALPKAPLLYSTYSLLLKEGGDQAALVAKLKGDYPTYKVGRVSDYIRQTFGELAKSVGRASWVVALAGLCLAGLVTFLFMKLLLAKDRRKDALLKALGFRLTDIRRQYLLRGVLVLGGGVLLGLLLVASLGQALTGLAGSLAGISGFKLFLDPIYSYLLVPASLFLAGGVAILLAGRDLESMKAQLLRE